MTNEPIRSALVVAIPSELVDEESPLRAQKVAECWDHGVEFGVVQRHDRRDRIEAPSPVATSMRSWVKRG